MTRLHIVGGGLAGMTVAWAVTRPDGEGTTPFDKVCLYESSHRLGGKAGSNAIESARTAGSNTTESESDPSWSDHGYHLFPLWYHNVIELMGEIGVDYDDIIVAGERFSQAARHPRLANPKDDDSRDVHLEYESASRLFWVAITTADLVSTDDDILRKWTMKDFIDERFPMLAKQVGPVYRGLLLKAMAAELNEMSALAVAKLFRRWSSPLLTLKDPSWSSLRGSLQTQFIRPFECALEASGVDIQTSARVDAITFRDHRAVELHIAERKAVDVEDDVVVLAVPPDALALLLATAPDELNLKKPLKTLADMTAQFAGVDVYFAKKQVTPREHFGFPNRKTEDGAEEVEQEVSTTAYNITPVWHLEELVDSEAKTVVQFVVPRPGGSTEVDVKDQVKRDVGKALEFSRGDTWIVNVNDDSPLSLANTGVDDACDHLTKALEGADDDPGNIKITGDFMPSSIGVPSMEAAVGSGRRVAAELRGEDPKEVDPDVRVSAVVRSIGALARLAVRPVQAVWSIFRTEQSSSADAPTR